MGWETGADFEAKEGTCHKVATGLEMNRCGGEAKPEVTQLPGSHGQPVSGFCAAKAAGVTWRGGSQGGLALLGSASLLSQCEVASLAGCPWWAAAREMC